MQTKLSNSFIINNVSRMFASPSQRVQVHTAKEVSCVTVNVTSYHCPESDFNQIYSTAIEKTPTLTFLPLPDTYQLHAHRLTFSIPPPPRQRKANRISEQALQICNSGTDLYTIVADTTMWTAGRTIKLTSGAPLHAHHHSFNLHILVQRCSKIITCLFIFMSCSGKTHKHRISYISYPVNHIADTLVVTISIRP